MYAIITISIVAILILFLGAIRQTKFLLPVIFVGLIAAFVVNLLGWNQNIHYINEMYINDNFTIAFNGILIFSTLLVFMLVPLYYVSVKHTMEDTYALILFALIGGLIMTAFGNLVMLFLGIETLSLSLYLLAGSKKEDRYSNEAAMKYFLTGSIASGFMLFGIAFLYGACGSFNMGAIQTYVTQHQAAIPVMFTVGLILIAVGLIFKIGAVPFHFWVPDVYQGSPTLITTFMATVGKIAAFAAFFRFVNASFMSIDFLWKTPLVVIAIATILYGNLTALYQNNTKRMMAYSAIAHAGYMLIAIIAIKGNDAGVLLLYAVAYSVATITAFTVIMMVRRKTGSFSIKSFNGLAKQYPLAAFALTIAMLSLAGIPPLIGFSAKYNLFATAIAQGQLMLIIIAIIGSMISVYYYLRPVVAMYFRPTSNEEPLHPVSQYKMTILVFVILLLLASIVPGLIIHLI
ncbi:NADH-quinone oxidoreductase subunit N [Microbacter margulisiae]|uniref:NADH-quinone oxidoreductase subunit N n=1 Tax=Microbacter margulisiae TaxID=1350067 RepID=A0A7W5DNU6_9PORP|nr:NADH-quinone oxidoreductase subunit N [Microbacter margulisiae]MBB3186296.1 NADH-quinone oxidoreductase subunit N [Microbacter margulisiae]